MIWSFLFLKWHRSHSFKRINILCYYVCVYCVHLCSRQASSVVLPSHVWWHQGSYKCTKNVHLQAQVNTVKFVLWIPVSNYLCLYLFVSISVSLYISVSLCISDSVSVHMCVHEHAYMCTCVCMNARVCVCDRSTCIPVISSLPIYYCLICKNEFLSLQSGRWRWAQHL